MTGYLPAASRSRLDSLTGLRFAAALLVFSTHASGLLRDTPLRFAYRYAGRGYVGVSFFFMLSGFVLMWNLRDDDRARAFWRRRAARILPGYWVAWSIGLVVTLWAHDTLTRGGAVLSFALVQSWRPVSTTYFAVNGPSWSLSCEMFFYLLSPWLLPLLARLRRADRRIALACSLLLATALPLFLVGNTTGKTTLWAVTTFPPSRMIEFVAGALLALEVADRRWRNVRLGPTLALSALGIVVAGAIGRNAQPFTVVPFALVIIAAAQADSAGRQTIFATPRFVALGAWSYAFYLLHEIVLRVTSDVFGSVTSVTDVVLRWMTALAISVAAAWAMYRFVEHPLERRFRAAVIEPRTDSTPA